MSLVIILYLAVLSAFTLGYIYYGINLFKNDIDVPGRKRIRIILKAQENDEIDFGKFKKYNAKLSLLTGLFYLLIFTVTFLFVPNLTGTLETREIHLIRTCIIAILVLHLSRDMWLATVREKFLKRIIKTEITKYNFKIVVVYVLLSVVLVYSIITQITYAW